RLPHSATTSCATNTARSHNTATHPARPWLGKIGERRFSQSSENAMPTSYVYRKSTRIVLTITSADRWPTMTTRVSSGPNHELGQWLKRKQSLSMDVLSSTRTASEYICRYY